MLAFMGRNLRVGVEDEDATGGSNPYLISFRDSLYVGKMWYAVR